MALSHLKWKLSEFIHSGYEERPDTFLRSSGAPNSQKFVEMG